MFKIKSQNNFSMLLIVIVIILPLNSSGSIQETSFTVTGFSKNMLLSTDDNNWNHHVEPMIAVSDNGTLFVGWKNANTHNGP